MSRGLLVLLLLAFPTNDRNGAIPSGVYVSGGTDVALADGGTSKSLTAVNGAVCWSDADSLELSAAGSSGQLLRSAGAASPTWTTATFPATCAANELDYCSATNTHSGLTSAASSVLATNGSSVPAWTTTLPALTLGGTLNASTAIITNIGNAGTDFTSAGGLVAAAPFEAPNGSASAPGFAFSSDNTNGLFLSGADTVDISAGGASRWQCFSTQCRTQGSAGISSSGAVMTTGGGLFNTGTVPTATLDGSTALAVTNNVTKVDCVGAEQITTITGFTASVGQTLTLIFTENECAVNDTDDGGSNTIDLDETDATGDNDIDSADDMVLILIYDGTLFRQRGRVSAN